MFTGKNTIIRQYNMRYLRFLLFLLLFGLLAWWTWRPLHDLLFPKSPRELYLREQRDLVGEEDPDLLRWVAVNERVLRNPLTIGNAFVQRLNFNFYTAAPTSAQAYYFSIPRGRRLNVEAIPLGPGQLFGELYRVGRDEEGNYYDRIGYWEDGLRYELSHLAGQAGEFVFLLQSELDFKSKVILKVQDSPSLDFPVAGVGDRAAQSFWGADRDGGRRKHEGVDIFAERGTDLLASAGGTITRVKEGGLGGKVVWMRTEENSLSLYYAHLSEQLVNVGDRVRAGDVIGKVGNTGNARTTPPHLHFGIYPAGRGAVDPWPFIDRNEDKPLGTPPDPAWLGKLATIPERGIYYLRSRPEKEESVIVRKLNPGEEVVFAGAQGKFRMLISEIGERGFVFW
ncbi:hypothetical protein CEQ90_01885 [Lewinellaceae bacterium SD302]|nr:hypothetical protein CEQ90_01885 [Lewinellaceae bacterium SD302]